MEEKIRIERIYDRSEFIQTAIMLKTPQDIIEHELAHYDEATKRGFKAYFNINIYNLAGDNNSSDNVNITYHFSVHTEDYVNEKDWIAIALSPREPSESDLEGIIEIRKYVIGSVK